MFKASVILVILVFSATLFTVANSKGPEIQCFTGIGEDYERSEAHFTFCEIRFNSDTEESELWGVSGPLPDPTTTNGCSSSLNHNQEFTTRCWCTKTFCNIPPRASEKNVTPIELDDTNEIEFFTA